MKVSIEFIKREDGVKIACTAFGTGQPLVFPAPWVTCLSYVIEDPFANRFWRRLAQGATIIMYDKHGCGHSDRDREDYTLEAELLDLETVISHLGLEQFNLLGSSGAGPVAIAYAAKNPTRVTKMVLYGTYANGKHLASEGLKTALISLIRASWGLGSKAIADIFIPGAASKELESLAKIQRESCSPETASKFLELSYALDVTAFLPTLETPTLVLHREQDKAISIDHGRHLAVEIPNARFKILKGSFHPWWYGESDEIIREIIEFINGEPSEKLAQYTSQFTTGDRYREDVADFPIDASDIVEQATIVFSDIVSSTQVVTELGDAAARGIFLQHDRVIRDQIQKHGGRELQNLGDGFMISFESASGAIKCACDIQKEIFRNIPSIKVRIGINSGEVVRREGRHPFGQAVVIASRIASRAKGDQILVSDVTRHLTSGRKFPFVEKGRFKPKGFNESMKLYEVSWNG